MQIKRYQIMHDGIRYKVIDKLKDNFVLIPLSSQSEEELLEIMGRDMGEKIDSRLVHEDYVK
jgi:hypothetical protein